MSFAELTLTLKIKETRLNYHKLSKMLLTFLWATLFYAAEFEGKNQPAGIGLVLSGGGAKAAAHIELLKAIDSLQIPISYVTGSSMGALLGAMYAIGYSGEEIDSLFWEYDWTNIIFRNVSPYSSLSSQEKQDRQHFIGSFPIRQNRISIPVSVSNGQLLRETLNQIFWPHQSQRDFSKFQIPFSATATDLETGESICFKTGYLPDVLYGSMAYPTFLANIEIDGRVVVDGGVRNNFPVHNLVEEELDIIIGSDVGTGLYSKDELTSLVNVLEQIAGYENAQKQIESQRMCDILMCINPTQFAASDFRLKTDIQNAGKKALASILPELKQLSFAFPKGEQRPDVQRIPTRKIERIRYIGLEFADENLVSTILGFKEGSIINVHELNHAISRVFGTGFFKSLNYELLEENGEFSLLIRVQEKTKSQFNFGVKYDSSSGASLLLNTTYTNVVSRGSRFDFNLILRELPEISVQFYKFNSFYPKMQIRASIDYNAFELPYKFYGQTRILTMDKLVGNFRLLHSPATNMDIESGISYNLRKLHPSFNREDLSRNEFVEYRNYGLNFQLRLNTLNRYNIPSEGTEILYRYDYNFDFELHRTNGEIFPNIFNDWVASQRQIIRLRKFYNLRQNMALEGRMMFAFHSENQGSPENMFYIASPEYSHTNFISVRGVSDVQAVGKTLLFLETKLLWEAWRNNYLMPYMNLLTSKRDDNSSLASTHPEMHLGLSFAYRSPIGPMEVSVSQSQDDYSFSGSVKVGFDF